MYIHPFPVYQGETFEIPLPTRNLTGSAASAGTWVDADFKFYKDGAVASGSILDAAVTASSDFDGGAGRSQVVIDTSADTGSFTLGSRWQVWAEKTIVSASVDECVAIFRIETAPEKSMRILRAFLYPSDSEITTTTGNVPGLVNLSDIVTASTTKLSGELLGIHYASVTDKVSIVRVTAYSASMATIKELDGTTPSDVTAGDHVWRVGQHTATNSSVADLPSATQVTGVGDNTAAIITSLTNLTNWLVIATADAGDNGAGAINQISFQYLTSASSYAHQTLVFYEATSSRYSSHWITNVTGSTATVIPSFPKIPIKDVDSFAILPIRRDQGESSVRTNVITTDDLTAWSQTGTPIVTGGVSDPFGGTDAYSVEDNDGVVLENIYLTVPANTMSGGTGQTKTAVWVVRENTHPASGGTLLLLYDNGAVASRISLLITAWTAGKPTSITENVGSVTDLKHIGNDYWAVYATSGATVITTNVHSISCKPANTASSTGSIDVWRINLLDTDVFDYEILDAQQTSAYDVARNTWRNVGVSGSGLTAVTNNILQTAISESYAADGVPATVSQLLYMIYGVMGEFSVSGTTMTVKRLDGGTTAMTFTFDNATTPTSMSRTG